MSIESFIIVLDDIFSGKTKGEKGIEFEIKKSLEKHKSKFKMKNSATYFFWLLNHIQTQETIPLLFQQGTSKIISNENTNPFYHWYFRSFFENKNFDRYEGGVIIDFKIRENNVEISAHSLKSIILSPELISFVCSNLKIRKEENNENYPEIKHFIDSLEQEPISYDYLSHEGIECKTNEKFYELLPTEKMILTTNNNLYKEEILAEIDKKCCEFIQKLIFVSKQRMFIEKELDNIISEYKNKKQMEKINDGIKIEFKK